MSSASASARRAKVQAHGPGGVGPDLAQQLALVAPRGLEELLDGQVARLEAVAEVVQALAHLLLDQRIGRVVGHEADERVDACARAGRAGPGPP